MVYGGGGMDAFVMKFNSAGTRLWASFYGTPNNEFGSCVAADMYNSIFIFLEPEDIYKPSLADACAWQSIFNGGSTTNPNGSTYVEDQLLIKISSEGKKLCATYIGGTGEDELDYGAGISIYGNIIYLTGSTDGGFPVTPGAFQATFGGPFVSLYNGGSDAYITSLCTNICEAKVLGLNFSANTINACTNAPIIFTPAVINTCDTTGYRFHWTFTGGNPSTSDSVSPTVIFSGVGAHDVKLVLTTICKKDSLTKTSYITVNNCSCTLAGQFVKGTSDCSNCGCKEWIMVTAMGGTSPYSYSWPDGYTDRYKNQLCPGAYTINIKDKNGCSVNVNLSAP